MADSTLDQDVDGLGAECNELARQALYQIEALVPVAQTGANKGVEPELLLGLLGRIEAMNHIAMSLLTDEPNLHAEKIAEARAAIFGRRSAVGHG